MTVFLVSLLQNQCNRKQLFSRDILAAGRGWAKWTCSRVHWSGGNTGWTMVSPVQHDMIVNRLSSDFRFAFKWFQIIHLMIILQMIWATGSGIFFLNHNIHSSYELVQCYQTKLEWNEWIANIWSRAFASAKYWWPIYWVCLVMILGVTYRKRIHDFFHRSGSFDIAGR